MSGRSFFWMLVAVAGVSWMIIFVAAGYKDIAEIFFYGALISLLVMDAHHIRDMWDEVKHPLSKAYRWFWRMPTPPR